MDWRKEMINCEKTDTDDYLINIWGRANLSGSAWQWKKLQETL